MKTAAVAALAALVALSACSPPKTAKENTPAPELAAVDRDGQAVKLGQYRDKVVLVTFWLSGCGPCLLELPALDPVYQRHKDRFAILAVNLGQDQTTIENAHRKVAVSFPFLADPLNITAQRYKVEAAPTAFLVDGKGVLRERIEGELSADALEAKLKDLL